MSRWVRGDRIAGRFVLEGRLAAGGMAEVFLAEMSLARGVSRRVALKRIHPHLAEDHEFVTMFLDEARMASQLTHPGIVPVIDAIEAEGDLLLVLEYVPGWDLSAVLAAGRAVRRPVPIGAALAITIGLAQTLAYVHTARDSRGNALGIVHRDLSPSNVLVAQDGSVRLLDFGVAKAAERATKTATQSLKGKFAYMAPEQARAEGVDARTDLYALGLVLFEMLCGRRGNDAKDDVTCLDRARAPKLPSVTAYRPDTPARLAAIVSRLCSPVPANRFTTAEQALAALERARSDVADVTAVAITDLVLELMGNGSRTPDDARVRLDRALAIAAGLQPGTGTPGKRVSERQSSPARLGLTRVGTSPSDIPETAAHDAPAAAATSAIPPTAVRASVSPHVTPHATATTLETTATTEIAHPRTSARTIALAIAAVLLVGSAGYATLRALGDDSRDTTSDATTVPTTVGFLRITSDPPGAAITIDGTPIAEHTPTIVESPAGRARTVALSLDDHVATTRTATSAAGRTTDVRATLARVAGSLEIVATPSEGARVSIDGVDRGPAPLVLDDLARRSHRVAVAAPGRATWEAVADLATHARLRLDARLDAVSTPVARGTLDISSTPWAEVRIDGRLVAESTPAVGLRLTAGSHTVVLTNPERGVRATRRVQIAPGGHQQLIVHLR